MFVTFIVWIHRHACVAEHRLRTGCGDHDLLAVLQRIADVVEVPLHFVMLHLDVRQSGLAAGTPVDHPLTAIDLPLFVERNEDLADGPRQPFIEGEPFASPVGRRPQGAHLHLNVITVLVFPFPDPVNERLPPQVVPSQSFFCQCSLDDVLGGDPGVIHAREPTGDVAVHPLVADDDVVQRVLKGIADVHCRCDVRWRDHHGEVPVVASIDLGMEIALLFPEIVQSLFYLGRLITLRKLHDSPCLETGTHCAC